MTVRQYSLAYPQRLSVVLGGALFMLGVGVWVMLKQFANAERTWFQFAFWTVYFLGTLYGTVRTLGSVHRIVVHEGDEVEFVSALERKRITARDIRSIRVLKGEYGTITVRHASGTVRLAGPMNDFGWFVTELQLANPGVQTVGV